MLFNCNINCTQPLLRGPQVLPDCLSTATPRPPPTMVSFDKKGANTKKMCAEISSYKKISLKFLLQLKPRINKPWKNSLIVMVCFHFDQQPLKRFKINFKNFWEIYFNLTQLLSKLCKVGKHCVNRLSKFKKLLSENSKSNQNSTIYKKCWSI